MCKKYELTDETIEHSGKTLHRIRALISFADVEAGDLGGFVESENNLSHEGDAWIYDDAKAYSRASVTGNAILTGFARISGDAKISSEAGAHHNAKIYGNATVRGHANLYEHASVSGTAEIYGHAELNEHASVFGNAKVHGHTQIYGIVHGRAEVRGHAKVYGEVSDRAKVYGHAKIYERGTVRGKTRIHGDAEIKDAGIYDKIEIKKNKTDKKKSSKINTKMRRVAKAKTAEKMVHLRMSRFLYNLGTMILTDSCYDRKRTIRDLHSNQISERKYTHEKKTSHQLFAGTYDDRWMHHAGNRKCSNRRK